MLQCNANTEKISLNAFFNELNFLYKKKVTDCHIKTRFCIKKTMQWLPDNFHFVSLLCVCIFLNIFFAVFVVEIYDNPHNLFQKDMKKKKILQQKLLITFLFFFCLIYLLLIPFSIQKLIFALILSFFYWHWHRYCDLNEYMIF